MKRRFLSQVARQVAIVGAASIVLSSAFVGLAAGGASLPAGANPDGSVAPDILKSASVHFPAMGTKGQGDGRSFKANRGVPGIDSLVNFTSQFSAPGVDPNGNPQTVWPFAMVGRPPQTGAETDFRAPIVPVVLDLLDQNGNIVLEDDPTPFVQPVLQSPIFTPAEWLSGFTQFNDAEMRSQFFRVMDEGYHNVLFPQVATTRHMPIPFGKYVFARNPDGSCCLFVLVDENTFVNGLFPQTSPVTNATPVGAAELAHEITTKDISTFLFKDVYLFEGTPANCCVLGFHTFDEEPGDAHNGNLPKIFVTIYASWITNGLFTNLEDISALSHEMGETFNDPFGNNITPWWLSQDPFSGNFQCQDLLEVGDVVEVLSSNPIFAKQVNGRTFHPQNLALLQWFEFLSPSNSQQKAYSFPDETTLTALSPFEQVNCGM